MTTTQAAYNAGILAALSMAEAVADGIEAQPVAGLRQLAASTALRSLAIDGRALLVGRDPNPIHEALKLIADDPADSGTIECPRCAGRLHWLRDGTNGHLHGQCETKNCLGWMQ